MKNFQALTSVQENIHYAVFQRLFKGTPAKPQHTEYTVLAPFSTFYFAEQNKIIAGSSWLRAYRPLYCPGLNATEPRASQKIIKLFFATQTTRHEKHQTRKILRYCCAQRNNKPTSRRG
jgi:hypothetical protein